MSSFNDWLEESTPDRREVPVCFDRRLLSQLVAAKDAQQAAKDGLAGMLGNVEHEAARELVTALEAKVREKERLLVFEGIGWGAWRDLIAKHPPQHDQAETFLRAVQLGFMPHAVENIAFDAETFVPAAISASCISPGITIPQANTLLRQQPSGVIERVWAAVLEANLSGGDDPFVGAAIAVASDGVRPTVKR